MKLRNKKTGEVINAVLYSPLGDCSLRVWEDKVYLDDATRNDGYLGDYETLAEFNEEWEDYKPSEPLIKDEKIRKAVRAWYDAIDYRIDNLLCIKTPGNTRLEISDGSPKLIYISLFVDKGTLGNIKDRTYYTIAELCGEEEE